MNQKRRQGPRGREWSQEAKRACSQNGCTVHGREAGERETNPASGLERSAEWSHGCRTVLVQTYLGPDIRKISLSLNLH